MSAVGRDVLHIGAKSLFASPARLIFDTCDLGVGRKSLK